MASHVLIERNTNVGTGVKVIRNTVGTGVLDGPQKSFRFIPRFGCKNLHGGVHRTPTGEHNFLLQLSKQFGIDGDFRLVNGPSGTPVPTLVLVDRPNAGAYIRANTVRPYDCSLASASVILYTLLQAYALSSRRLPTPSLKRPPRKLPPRPLYNLNLIIL